MISNLGFGYHFYADDVQFHITLNHTNAFDASMITRASFFNKVNYLLVSWNDMLFCKNSKYKE